MTLEKSDSRQRMERLLADTPNLAEVLDLVAREKTIRHIVQETGDTRRGAAEVLDGLEAMSQETVMEVTHGNPTTLRDALSLLIEELDDMETGLPGANEIRHHITERLAALAAYPWSEDERVQLHDLNTSLHLRVVRDPSGWMDVWIGDHRVAHVTHYRFGWEGMESVVKMIVDVYQSVLARVVADRDHHVLLDATERRSLSEWLNNPNGSWVPENSPYRFVMDAVSGGGVLARTRPYRRPETPRTQI